MSRPMTLQTLRNRNPVARKWAIGGMAMVLGLGLSIPGRRVRFVVENFGAVPEEPVLFALNHTHFVDWIAMRWVAFLHGRMQLNWVKPRTYERGFSRFLDLTGNVPLTSRGYLISADVRAVADRAPSEDEYRILRDHVDTGEPLPDGELYEALQYRPRAILGLPFDPDDRTWRRAIEVLFEQMMQATLGHTRTLVNRGLDLAVMPQGSTSMRLTRGHSGALQAALWLDIPVVAVGISGFPQAFGDSKNIPRHGGTVIVRIGDPYRPQKIEGHAPFRAESEREHRDALVAGTRDMMERINALLEPEHQWADDLDDIDISGVARFI